jgi:hypothetical protein
LLGLHANIKNVIGKTEVNLLAKMAFYGFYYAIYPNEYFYFCD